MLKKIIRILLLVLLGWLYAQNVVNNLDNWQGVVIYSRINFVILVLFLYLAAGFIPFFEYLCAIVLVSGLIFHTSMYYQAYTNAKHNQEVAEAQAASLTPKVKRCSGENTNWYKRLNDSCY